MTLDQRQPFLDMAAKDGDRFDKDVRDYQRRLAEAAGNNGSFGGGEGEMYGMVHHSGSMGTGSGVHIVGGSGMHMGGMQHSLPYQGQQQQPHSIPYQGQQQSPRSPPYHQMPPPFSFSGGGGMGPQHGIHMGTSLPLGIQTGLSILPGSSRGGGVQRGPYPFGSLPGVPGAHLGPVQGGETGQRGQNPAPLDHGLGLDVHAEAEFERAMSALRGRDAAAAAAAATASIDLFGCSARVLLTASGPAVAGHGGIKAAGAVVGGSSGAMVSAVPMYSHMQGGVTKGAPPLPVSASNQPFASPSGGGSGPEAHGVSAFPLGGGLSPYPGPGGRRTRCSSGGGSFPGSPYDFALALLDEPPSDHIPLPMAHAFT